MSKRNYLFSRNADESFNIFKEERGTKDIIRISEDIFILNDEDSIYTIVNPDVLENYPSLIPTSSFLALDLSTLSYREVDDIVRRLMIKPHNVNQNMDYFYKNTFSYYTTSKLDNLSSLLFGLNIIYFLEGKIKVVTNSDKGEKFVRVKNNEINLTSLLV